MKAINIKAYTADVSQIDAIKAFMKALKIKFEVSNSTDYNPEFVEKVLQGDKDFAQGKGRKVSLDELHNL